MAPNNQGRGREWPFPFANVRKADFTTKFDAIQRVETIAQSSEPLTRENSVEVCTCACVCVIPACRGFRANLCAPVPLTTLGPWRGSVNGNVSSKLACGREKERAARLFSSGNFQYLACLFIRPGKWKTEISVFPRGNSRVADNVSPTQSIRYAFHDVLETVNHECSIKWYEKWIYKSRTSSMWN